MTKKDYELIARVIKAICDRDINLRTKRFIANVFCYELSFDNPSFNAEKFGKACGL